MRALASEEKSFMQTTFSFFSARVSNHIYFSRLEIVYDARARKVTEQLNSDGKSEKYERARRCNKSIIDVCWIQCNRCFLEWVG